MTSGLQEQLPRVLEEASGLAYEIDGTYPRLVARPSDVEGVSETMRFAHEQGLAVVPWGGGTRIQLGNIPGRYDVALDITGVNRMVDHTPGDLTATAEAGMRVAALQESLGRHGQILAIDSPLPERATLGGTLAVGWSGPFKWQYGSIRDTVIGMKVVQADGTVTKSGGQVVKNVSGFDMARLHIGALGTLGVIAEVSLKLTPRPADRVTALAGFDRPSQCIDAALGIFSSGLMPLAVAVFDAQTGGAMDMAYMSGSWSLAVLLGGRPRTIERQSREVGSIVERMGTRSPEMLSVDEAAPLWRALSDFGWDEASRPALGVRASVLPSGVAQVVEGLKRLETREGTTPAIAAHPAHGTVLASWPGDGEEGASVLDTLRHVRALAAEAGGHAVVERAPLTVKSEIDVWGGIGGPERVARGLKRQYDPDGILNPGRFAGRL